MSASPEFSVIVPTYDRPVFLGEALASIASQTIDDFECLVVDDGSREPVDLSQYELDQRFRVLRSSSNRGPGAARNLGATAATGRSLCFLDDDDVYVPERLEMAREGLARAPIAICWQRYMRETIEKGRVLEGDVCDTILDQMTPSLIATALRRDAFVPFDESYRACQDVEWWLRITQEHKVTTVPRVGSLVRQHDGVRNLNGPLQRAKFTERMIEHHREYFHSHPKALAMRSKRAGLWYLRVGDSSDARRAFRRSFRASPSVRTAWHYVRSFRRQPGALVR